MIMELTEGQLIEMYEEALNEGEEIKIGTLTYLPAEVLKAVDPIAYQVGLHDYADILMQDGYQIEGYN